MDINLNTIYNEGKNQIFTKKSSQTFSSKGIEDFLSCTKTSSKSDLFDEIKKIQENTRIKADLLNKSKDLSGKYGIPSKYIFLTLTNNGEIKLDSNDKFHFSSSLTKLNIGTQRTFTWSENGKVGIVVSRSTGSSIMQLDDEEMEDILEYIDNVNEEIRKLLKEEREKIEEKEIKEAM